MHQKQFDRALWSVPRHTILSTGLVWCYSLTICRFYMRSGCTGYNLIVYICCTMYANVCATILFAGDVWRSSDQVPVFVCDLDACPGKPARPVYFYFINDLINLRNYIVMRFNSFLSLRSQAYRLMHRCRSVFILMFLYISSVCTGLAASVRSMPHQLLYLRQIRWGGGGGGGHETVCC